MRFTSVLGLVLGLSSTLAAPALADGRVIELARIDIRASPQRPNAFYVLERSASGLEVLDLRTTFTDEIVRDADSVD